MTNAWHKCKSILIIRPDNMGDVVMMTPALRALKQTLACKITLLTSELGSLIAPYISYIDETLLFNVPWVKTNNPILPDDCIALVEKLKSLHFDGAIISTVYSQNPLPAAMIAFMAGIPLRLSYCRENPYFLLTDWLPDKEPYSFIQHQVKRELNLVNYIGASAGDERLSLCYDKETFYTATEKLSSAGIDINKPWMIIHPGVSEIKREYPSSLWIKTARQLYQQTGNQLLITGSSAQLEVASNIERESGMGIFSIAGLLNIEELIVVIAHARLVISVNTAIVHIAAATNTPVIVLYALTNPQHTPWQVASVVLTYSVAADLQSKNEVIQHVNRKYAKNATPCPSPAKIVKSALGLLSAPRVNDTTSLASA